MKKKKWIQNKLIYCVKWKNEIKKILKSRLLKEQKKYCRNKKNNKKKNKIGKINK